VTNARSKRLSGRPRKHSHAPASDDTDQLGSRTRLKRAAVEPEDTRDAIEASLDAAMRELDELESGRPTKKKNTARRVPPFPGTGITLAVPPLPSTRPKRSR